MSRSYIHYGSTEFLKDVFMPVTNMPGHFPKPLGGFWASRLHAKHGWKQWNKKEHYACCDEGESVTFELAESSRVLEIHSIQEIKNLDEKYFKEKGSYESFTEVAYLDFEKLTEDYDAIEVFVSEDRALYWALYGWDCDSILILNPDIIINQRSGKR